MDTFRRKIQTPARILLLMLCCLTLWTQGAQAGAPPSYSWGAFQRFWNTCALVGVEITNPEPLGEGYIISFGYSANMTIFQHKGYVIGIRIQFRDAPGLEAGGPKFLRAMQTAIRLGTYGWPEDRALEVRKAFAHMLPERRVYQWRNSRFTRVHYSTGDWEFLLDFVPSEG